MERDKIINQLFSCEKRLIRVPQYSNYRDASASLKKMIEDILINRQRLLNKLFLGTEAEIERLKQINDRLLELTHKMYSRAYQLYQVVCSNGYNPDFDDDVTIEGVLTFTWNSLESSYLPMKEDSEYGSDFPVMMELLDGVYYDKSIAECSSCNVFFPYGEPITPNLATLPSDKINLVDRLNDGQSWNEYPFNRNEFNDIVFCYPMHVLCNHQLWSIPDVLRMNEFCCEVKVSHQHLVDLAGNRFPIIGQGE